MNFSSKYGMGQRVWSISRSTVELPPVACPACEDGMVELRGERYTCPRCGGKREVKKTAEGWIRGVSGVIGEVRIEVDAKDADVKYMIDSTGVGSGRVYYETDLWPSREEAQAECDRRNAAISPNKDGGGR